MLYILSLYIIIYMCIHTHIYIVIYMFIYIYILAFLVKNPPAMQETRVWFLGRDNPLGKWQVPTPVFMGFLDGSDGKELTCNAGDLGSIPGLGRSPGGGYGSPLQYSCLENPHGQRSPVGYSPWGCKESDMNELKYLFYFGLPWGLRW